MLLILLFCFPLQVTNRMADSLTTPDSIEKAIVQPRRAHSARGLGLLVLSFSTLGMFFAFFSPFFDHR